MIPTGIMAASTKTFIRVVPDGADRPIVAVIGVATAAGWLGLLGFWPAGYSVGAFLLAGGVVAVLVFGPIDRDEARYL